jgi:hypothetical protein
VPIIANHLRVDGYANGWIINIPGTYTLTIFYGLQNYAELGFYISTAAILSLVSIVVMNGLKGESRRLWLRRLGSIIRYRKAPTNEGVSDLHAPIASEEGSCN